MLKRQVIITNDGSSTIFVPQLNQCYHSTHGAINESQHIFIEAGFNKSLDQLYHINILEVGFGTGLNALLTLVENADSSQTVFYQGIEPHPVHKCELSQINYADKIPAKQTKGLFEKIHNALWDEKQPITGNFELLKTNNTIETVSLPNNFFHLVYFDAFAPTIQPELWKKEIFEKIFQAMSSHSILVTYSCKGDVKRALKASGFTIEKLPGPTGKREFIRAFKN
ncbi:MAG: tRNA (5-methylaminomethyl-2-thiouridine)(34)-methyltransferase MnmD [Bacteroidota bacterium]